MSVNNEIVIKFLSDINDLKKDVNTIKGQVGGLGGFFSKIGLALNGVQQTIGRVVRGVGRLIANFVTAASDAEEMSSKFDVVFGKSADAVDKWATDHGNKVGRATNEIKEMISTIQDTFVPLGYQRDQAAKLSVQMGELAIDVASFNNAQDTDVMRDFQSALVGNHETVRKYGIVITEETLKQEAYASGITKVGEELTNMEKVQARINIIMKGTTDAHGDAERTMSSNANTLKSLRAEWREYTEDMGEKIIPVATEFFEFARDKLIPIVETVTEKVIDFFLSFTENSLEKTIREMKELGMETLEYEIILARMNKTIADQAAMGLDENKITSEMNNNLDRRQQLLKEIADEQNKLIENGKSEDDLRKEINYQMALGVMFEGSHNADLVIKNQNLLANIDAKKEEINELEKESKSLTNNLKTVREQKQAQVELNALLQARKDIINSSSSDDDSDEEATSAGVPTKAQLDKMAKEAQDVLDKFHSDHYQMNTSAQQQEIDQLAAHHQQIVDAISTLFGDSDAEYEQQAKAYELYNQKLTEIEEKYSDQRRMITFMEMRTRLQVYSSMLSGLSALFGEFSVGQKAAARLSQAAAIVSTYTAATQALQAPPIGYGPVLGPFAAVGIVAQGLANVVQIQKAIANMKKAATGADFVTNGPMALIVGDNPGGKEHVQVTPMGSPNLHGPQPVQVVEKHYHYHFSGNVLTKDFIRWARDEIGRQEELGL